MRRTPGAGGRARPEDIPEGTRDADLDGVLRHWRTIAALAWRGFSKLGRGAVVVTVDDGAAEIAYQPGPPCDCHRHWIAQYDPARQVIVVVRRQNGERIYPLSGWPCPPDAHREATVQRPADVR